MRNHGVRLGLALLAVACLAGLLAGTSLADVPPVGTLYEEQPERAGELESAGRPVDDGALVHTDERAAVVRLNNGRVLKLAPGSAARLAAGSDGTVSVSVLAGRVGVIGDYGRPLTAGQRSTFTLAPSARDPLADEDRLLEVDLDRPPPHEEPRTGRTARAAR